MFVPVSAPPSPALLLVTYGVTCHIRRLILRFVASYTQLAVAVVSPALNPASSHDRASVVIPSGNGYGGETCEGMLRLCVLCVGRSSGCWPHTRVGLSSPGTRREGSLSQAYHLVY
jgi:hypothetical protein